MFPVDELGQFVAVPLSGLTMKMGLKTRYVLVLHIVWVLNSLNVGFEWVLN